MKTRIIYTLVPAALVLTAHAAAACSVCITGAAGERLTDAFNWSVIFLMAMPYTILLAIVGFFIYAYRRAAKKARAEESAELRPASELP